MTVTSTFNASFNSGTAALADWALQNLTVENFSAYPEVKTQDDILALVSQRTDYIVHIVAHIPGLTSREEVTYGDTSSSQTWTWQDQASFDAFYSDFTSNKRSDVSGWDAFENGKKNAATGEVVQLSAEEYAYFLYRKANNLNFQHVYNG
jgi:hypothetical protein